MSFKLQTGAVEDRLAHQVTSVQPPFSVSPTQEILLNFILANAQGDERPYLTVSISGTPLLGLLDSGASKTIVGAAGWEILKSLGFQARKNVTACRVADGRPCHSPGTVLVPIKLRDVEKLIDIVIVPEVSSTLILGADFWRAMGIVPDLRRGEWSFSSSLDVQVSSLSDSNLKADQRSRVDQLVEKLFSKVDSDRIGCTNLVEHVIVTDSEPIKQRYYNINPHMQKLVNVELDKLLEQGIVEPSSSPWSSPILLVPKKDKSYRFVVDYRKLNRVTRKDAYPLPYISHTLDKLRDARYLTSLDIKSAYFQIPMAESSKQYTAFTVPNRGLFQFRRLPMGLSGSPAVWQRFIDRVLGADLDPYVFAYLDDIIVIGPTFEKHLEVLAEVIKRIHGAGLTLNKDKCQFCREELRYLGYMVNRSGLHVDPEKIQAILDIPTPKSVSEVRRVVATASWYRRFIKDFSTIVSPLTDLLKKNRAFVWSDECTRAWAEIKERLVTAPVLACPDFSREFVVQCDGSNFGIGAVLTQDFEDGEKVIAYISRSLTRQERNFTTTEKECLAVLWAIEKFRPYVEGSHFTVITDHYSLVWLNNLKNPTGRLARWAVRLQQYDYTIVHRKGKEHVVPDALSRAVPVLETVEVTGEDSVSADKWYQKLLDGLSNWPEKYPGFQLIDGVPHKFVCSPYPELVESSSEWKRVIPKGERKTLLRQCHDEPTSGHLGTYKTLHRLSQRVYWPGMKADVHQYIRNCTTCMRAKPMQQAPAGLMGGHSSVSKPWEVICADLVGPLPRTSHGNQFILVISDCFSKYSLFFPLRKATASAVSKHLENDIFLQYGVPRALITDNGVQFRSKEFQKLMQSYSVQILFTSYYNPKANPTERVNRVLKTMLVSYISNNHRIWDELLPKVGCAVRTAQHEVTGLSPYFVNFGREMILTGTDHQSTFEEGKPIEVSTGTRESFVHRSEALTRVYKDIRLRLQQAYEKSKGRYDLRRRDVTYLPNQLIWRKNFVLSDAAKYFSAKLADKFVGPFRIHRKVGRNCYELKDLTDKILVGTWHVSHLKPHPE